MAKKSKKQDAANAATVENTPAIQTVAYEKIGADGTSEKDFLPISGKTVRVYSKWQHDLRYETTHGIVVIRGLASSPVVAPYVTSNIPVECWNWIVEIYGKTNMFRNHFVYATEQEDADYGDDKAKELAGEKTGIEQLEQGKIASNVTTFERSTRSE
jgi:hypothetical protein